MIGKASISVIVPCYNCYSTLKRAVDSVLEQSLKPMEIILIDDASTDNTIEIIKDYAKKTSDINIRFKRMSKNLGAACARNVGIKLAREKYIAFLDADDSWHWEKLRLQFDWMESNPAANLLAHHCKQIANDSEDINKEISDFDKAISEVSFDKLLFRNRFSTPSVFMRRREGIFFDENLRYAEDYELWLRVSYDYGGVFVASTDLAYLYKARFGSSGLSSHLWNMQLSLMSVYIRMWKTNRTNIYRVLGIGLISMIAFFRRCVVSSITRIKQ